MNNFTPIKADFPNRKKQVIELSVFLFLIMPSMVLSFFIIKQGAVSFAFTAVTTILRDLALVALVIYFIWNNSEPFSNLGFHIRNPGTEIVTGGLLFIPFFYISAALDAFLLTHGFHAPKAPATFLAMGKGGGEIFMATLLVIVVAICEETIFRGYLILRFKGVTSSAAWAVFLSSFVFSLGHGYEGSAGVITVGIMGAMFALVYLWRGNLLAAMTMHFLQDFISIVLIPATR